MIKANTLILIELTSMAGEAAMIQIDLKANMTKVQHKLNFYNNLFMYNRDILAEDDIDITKSDEVLVLFIYNGMDPVEMQNSFVSENFKTLVVHLPFVACQEWSISLTAKKAKEAKRKAKEAVMRAVMRAEKAVMRAEKAEKSLKRLKMAIKRKRNSKLRAGFKLYSFVRRTLST